MIRIIIGGAGVLLWSSISILGIVNDIPNTAEEILAGMIATFIPMLPWAGVLAWGIVSRHNSKKQLEGVK